MEAEEDLPEDDVDDAPGDSRGAGGGGLPDMAGLASMLGGGGRGGGGMPDLSSIMSNPMFASMAQNLMRNPDALSGLMNNPTIQNMMNNRREGGGGSGGGGMPDMGSIQQMMQDPAIANLAQQFMGGGAGAGAGGGGAGGAPGAGRGAGR